MFITLYANSKIRHIKDFSNLLEVELADDK